MWGEAIYCATYILNRLPSDALKNKTPYEMWIEKRPNGSNMQKFGSILYAKQLHPNIKKLDPRSKKLIMIGYTNNVYRLWNVKERKIEISRDIVIISGETEQQKEGYNKRKISTSENDEETTEYQEETTENQEEATENQEETTENQKETTENTRTEQNKNDDNFEDVNIRN